MAGGRFGPLGLAISTRIPSEPRETQWKLLTDYRDLAGRGCSCAHARAPQVNEAMAERLCYVRPARLSPPLDPGTRFREPE